MHRTLIMVRDVYKIYTKLPKNTSKSVKIEKITNPWSGKALNVKTLNIKNSKLIDSIINNYYKV